MKPVKRETVSLAELHPGDTCVLAVEPDAFLMVKVVAVLPEDGLLRYRPAIFSAVGVPEFVATGEKVYTYACPPGMRLERIWIEGGE